ncbi:hypothetical protein [Flavobacterium saliperosum]|uniref:Uncharacterized protein n=1 Tax=Flavobacterium saliperosum TaxID=329186 RepID=A0A1G4VVJ3_9FLAO|nr:hypothetical protein [Flavobacterium saliperosum]SCX12598.1 hypothetical protein SAMN02927925_01825 [Flavobacterium saliperosum]
MPKGVVVTALAFFNEVAISSNFSSGFRLQMYETNLISKRNLSFFCFLRIRKQKLVLKVLNKLSTTKNVKIYFFVWLVRN